VIVLLDTDVLIDVALDRTPHAEPAAALLDALEQEPGQGHVAWHSIANFYYLVRPSHGHVSTKAFVVDLVKFVSVATTTTSDLLVAARLQLRDFEDAMQVAAALACKADVIATRNVRDYKNSPIEAVKPSALLSSA